MIRPELSFRQPKSRRFREVSWSDFWWLWPTLTIVAIVGAMIGLAR